MIPPMSLSGQVFSVILSWMAKRSLASSGLSCCPVVVPRAAVTEWYCSTGKKVQHGAEAFTDIISLIIALSPE
jgi:hypothetical protein